MVQRLSSHMQHTDRRQLRIHAFDCIEGDGGERLCFHCSREIRGFIYPLHQAKAIKFAKSDFISQSWFFSSQAKTALTPVLLTH